MIVGRRWRQAHALNERNLSLAQEAIADRKKILAALEDIRTMLKDRNI
jgi:hypothetical protein